MRQADCHLAQGLEATVAKSDSNCLTWPEAADLGLLPHQGERCELAEQAGEGARGEQLLAHLQRNYMEP